MIRIGDHTLKLEKDRGGGKFRGRLRGFYIHCEIGLFPDRWPDTGQKLTRGELVEVEQKLCRYCKFHDVGCFCFPEIEFPPEECTDDIENWGTEILCPVCCRWVDFRDAVVHHVSYDPEETVEVCKSCHMKIHMSPNHPLKPSNRRPKRARVFKYVPCSRCGRRTRVPYETPSGTPALCSHCKAESAKLDRLIQMGVMVELGRRRRRYEG
jgi:hypothetical protein